MKKRDALKSAKLQKIGKKRALYEKARKLRNKVKKATITTTVDQS